MGMFNTVNFQTVCPLCGTLVTGFQTKDGDELDLRTVQPLEVDNFYSQCDKCDTWLEYTHLVNRTYVRTAETPKEVDDIPYVYSVIEENT